MCGGRAHVEQSPLYVAKTSAMFTGEGQLMSRNVS